MLHMYLQDLRTSLDIRQTHSDTTIETPGSQQGIVQNVGALGRWQILGSPNWKQISIVIPLPDN